MTTPSPAASTHWEASCCGTPVDVASPVLLDGSPPDGAHGMSTSDALTHLTPERYGPWAVLAGGSEGVGEHLARQLAAAGIHLVLVARKPEPLARTAELAASHGVEVRTVSQDLTAPDCLDRIREVTDDLEVGLLVLNAGANTHHGEFVDSDPADIQRVIDLNVTTPLAMVRHYGAPMKQRGHGGIVLTGSLAGYTGSPIMSTYAAVKAFGRIFAEGLWYELGEHGVDVVEVVLGVTRTPAMARLGMRFDLPGMVVSEPEDVATEVLASLPNGPVHVISGNEAMVEARSGGDRAKAVAATYRATSALAPD